MNITRQDREALDEILEFFDDCKDLTEDHVNAMLVILVEHRQRAVSAATEKLRVVEGERDGLQGALENVVAELESLPKCHPSEGEACSICESLFVATKALAALSPGKGGE